MNPLAKKKMFEQQSDDQVAGKLLAQKQDKQKWPDIDIPTNNHNKIPAESFWSTGRNCPRCAGKMTGYEFNDETGYQWLKCSSCGFESTAQELNRDEYDDTYRLIPDDVILKWMQMRERQLDKREKEKG